MRAMQIHAFGPADAEHLSLVTDAPEPTLREHDVLVEVYASSINPVDTKVRQGAGIYGKLPLPLTTGYDVSGIVRAMGPAAEASGRFKVGDAVYASPSLARDGAHAELVAVDARSAAHKPRSLSHVEAAAMPLVTLTAWESLHTRARMHKGESVLVQAGAGGVGHVALQLARNHGCRVIATAGADDSIELCRSLGAAVVVNYRRERVVERVLAETGGRGVDVALDCVGGEALEQCMDAVALNGRVVGIVHTKTDTIFDKLFRKSATLHLEFMGVPTFFGVNPGTQGETLATAAELIDAGKLRPHVHKVIALGDIPAAHAEIAAARTRGKIVVKLRD